MSGICVETGFWLLEIIMDEMENEGTEVWRGQGKPFPPVFQEHIRLPVSRLHEKQV